MITLNGHEVKPTIFPDKTSQVWKLDEEMLNCDNDFKIVWKFESEAELIHLGQLNDLLRRVVLVRGDSPLVLLHLTYLPYARQDKEVSNIATFGLRTFASMLNGMSFDEITCLDPHSRIAEELIHNFKPLYPHIEIERAMLLTGANFVCYPDKGAVEKYSRIYKHPFIYGEKVRDQATGNITSYEVFEGKLGVKGKNILVVDDLCDGGMTFILLAKQLKELGANEVDLFVSHGLFTRGKQVLHDAGIRYVLTPEDLDE